MKSNPIPVTRVVIASESRIAGSVMEELFVIRTSFLAAEDSKEVHAAVLYSTGWFVIWIEGPEEGIEAVLKRSTRDPRHAHLRVIHRSTGRRALAERLTLASTQGADQPFEFGRRIHAVEKASPGLEPATIWRRLSAPWTLSDPAELLPPSANRVALLGCDDNSVIDLLRRVADRFRGRLVYQRFANGKRHSRDVGAAYVDLPMPGCETRVQAISRRAIEHVIVRESIERARAVALVVGDRPGPAILLAEALATFATDCAILPAVHVVAESSVVGHAVADLFNKVKNGLRVEVAQPGASQMVDFILGLAQRGCIATA